MGLQASFVVVNVPRARVDYLLLKGNEAVAQKVVENEPQGENP